MYVVIAPHRSVWAVDVLRRSFESRFDGEDDYLTNNHLFNCDGLDAYAVPFVVEANPCVEHLLDGGGVGVVPFVRGMIRDRNGIHVGFRWYNSLGRRPITM